MACVYRSVMRRTCWPARAWTWVLAMAMAVDAGLGWGEVRAATKTFRGTLDNGSFSRGANWIPNGVPQDGDDLIIDPITLNDGPPLISSVATNDLPTTLQVRNLTLIGARLFGKPLLVTGKVEGYLNVPEIHVDLTLTGDREVRADAGRLELHGALTITGDTRFVVGGPRTVVSGQHIEGSLEVRGAIRGTGNIICVQDAGTAEGVFITGTQANSYTGAFIIDGPPVEVTRTQGKVFTGAVEVRRGRLSVSSDDAALAGALIKALAGTSVSVTHGWLPALHLVDSRGQVQTGVGDLTLEGADLTLYGTVGDILLPARGGYSVISGTMLAASSNQVIRVESGAVLAAGASMRMLQANSATIKEGGGVLELTGGNELGTVEIRSGLLRCGSPTNLGPSRVSVAVRSGGAFQVAWANTGNRQVPFDNVDLILYDGALWQCGNVIWNGDVQTFGTPVIAAEAAGRLELGGSIRGPGGLAIESGSSGVVRVTGPGKSTFSGMVQLRSGGVELARTDAWGSAPWMLESNTWVLLDSAQTVPAINLRGGRIYSSASPLTLLGPLVTEGDSADSQMECRLAFGAGAGVISNSAPLRIHGEISSTEVLRKVGRGDLLLESGLARTEVTGWRVEEGRVIAGDGRCFGETAVTVTVLGGATLRCVDSLGGPVHFAETAAQLAEGATLEGNCAWLGEVALLGTATVRPDPSIKLLGSVVGPGGLTVDGDGSGELELRCASSHAGPTRVLAGALRMGRAGVAPGPLIVGQISGPPAVARWAADDAVNPRAAISVWPTGLADLNGYHQAIAGLSVQRGEIRTGAGELILEGDLTVPLSLVEGAGLVRGRLGLSSGQHAVDVRGTSENGLVLAAALTGDGGLTKTGPGWLQLTGSTPNEHQGATLVQAGLLVLNKTNFVEALAGAPLMVASNAAVRWEGNGQLSPETSVTGVLGARFDLGAVPLVKPEVIGSLAGDGLLQVGSNIVQVGGNHLSTAYAGIFEGRGAVVKLGAGTWTLTGRNPFEGLVRSAGGLVQVDGALLAANFLATNSGGLGGTGFVQSVTVSSNAVLAPGASPGILTMRDLTMRPGSKLVMELNGNGPGTGFDQIEVTGSATIDGAVAELRLGFVPALGKTFRLFNVTSEAPLNGNLRGWGQNGANGFDGLTFRADYHGGTGNDLVAEVISLGAVAPNQPPVFAAPAPATVAEGEELARVFAAAAPESDQTVTYSLAGVPLGGAILDATTGAFTWTPRERQGPSTNHFVLVASDNGQPALSVTQHWTVVVTEANTPPTLAAIAPVTLAEGDSLDLQLEATDADRPAQTLEYSWLDPAPNGLTLDPVTGRLRWTPAENQGPSTAVLRVKVSDSGVPRLSATNTVQITVTESNERPVMEPLADWRVEVGQWVEFTVRATDPDRPANALAYSLGATAPPQAALGVQTGLFRWLPTEHDVGIHLFDVEVGDQGAPPKKDRQTLMIEVIPATPVIVNAELLASGLLELSWSTNLAGYELVRSGQLVSSNWVSVSEVPSVRGDRYRVQVTAGGAQRYFQLRSR